MTPQECVGVVGIQPAGCTSKSKFVQTEERCLCGCTIRVHGLTAGLWDTSRVLTSLGKHKLRGCQTEVADESWFETLDCSTKIPKHITATQMSV